jgi:hypothetical protein
MSDGTEDRVARIIPRLEELGEAQVRFLMSRDGFPSFWLPTIAKWLADKGQESELRREASQAEQIDIASSAKDAAWEAARAANKANTIAAIAVAMATIAIIISTFAWIYPRH